MWRTYERNLERALVTADKVTPEEMTALREQQRQSHESLDKLLVSSGRMTELEILQTLSEFIDVPAVVLANRQIDPALVDVVPRELCERHAVFPVELDEDNLTLAMTDPSNVLIIDELRHLTRRRIRPLLATSEDIRRAIVRYYSKTVQDDTGDQSADGPSETVVVDRLRELVDQAPVVGIANSIIEAAIKERASDIHIELQEDEFYIRFRIDGIMYDYMTPARHLHSPLISRIKIMAGMDIAERRMPQDGRIAIQVDGQDFDIRVSSVPTTMGEKAVLRLLNKSESVLQLDQLGMDDALQAQMEDFIQRPYGMLLVTGPTGSGKTTTLYAALSRIDSARKNVITVEDPVEYQLPRIAQIQVHHKIGLTFAAGLRAILRQDPDVIMVGEIRDYETLSMAIQAALTGHFVFTTLHCNDSAGAAARCIDMGLEPFLFTSAITGILAQRLLRRLCPECKQSYKPPKPLLAKLGLDPDDDTIRFHRGQGCDHCRQSGYYGRTSCFEIVRLSDELKSAILEKRSASELRRIAAADGAELLPQQGVKAVLAGITSVEEMMRAVYVDE